MSLYGYVHNSPSDFDIYLTNAKAQEPSFLFNPVHDNDVFFFPPSPSTSHLSSIGDPMRNSFRMVLEKIG